MKKFIPAVVALAFALVVTMPAFAADPAPAAPAAEKKDAKKDEKKDAKKDEKKKEEKK